MVNSTCVNPQQIIWDFQEFQNKVEWFLKSDKTGDLVQAEMREVKSKLNSVLTAVRIEQVQKLQKQIQVLEQKEQTESVITLIESLRSEIDKTLSEIGAEQ